MSKASIAQEPSMDEILASIRRIIETGEDRTGAAPNRAMLRDMPFASLASASPATPAPKDEAVSESPASVEDRLTEALEIELAETWEEPKPEPAVEPIAPEATESAERISAFDGDEAPSEATPAEEPQSWTAFSPLPDYGVARDVPPSASSESRTADDAGESVLAAPFMPANTDRPMNRPQLESAVLLSESETGSGLLSERSGALVASSFEELAQAIRNGELRSIEAMAQEMLRPMLQEWLDDNLPHMVERLVREEIERMSRGGRR